MASISASSIKPTELQSSFMKCVHALFKNLCSCQYLWNFNFLSSLPRAKSEQTFICLSFLYADEMKSFDNLSHVSISLTDCYAMLCNTATILYMCSQKHLRSHAPAHSYKHARGKKTQYITHRSLNELNYWKKVTWCKGV